MKLKDIVKKYAIISDEFGNNFISYEHILDANKTIKELPKDYKNLEEYIITNKKLNLFKKQIILKEFYLCNTLFKKFYEQADKKDIEKITEAKMSLYYLLLDREIIA